MKKKNPLILPPDYEKIPEPGSTIEKKKNDEDKIKKILKAPKKEKISNKNHHLQKNQFLIKIRK